MDTVKQAQKLLEETETALQKLVAHAACEGEYEAVVTIAAWAKAMRSLPDSGTRAPCFGSREGATPPPRTPTPRVRQLTEKPTAQKLYPKFFRDSASVIKVAWSKSAQSEYEHKAPWTVVQQLAAAVKQEGEKGELISMDNVLPLKSEAEGDVPSYQAYLCLAWLRHEGLVRQHGRRGYSLRPGIDIIREATKAWESLPKRGKV